MAFHGDSLSSSPFYSSSSTARWEVFLSFRGKDTRKTFTAYLWDALRRRGIHTFMDDKKLKSGEKISSTLVKAIEESEISIIVFSKNYASSRWCMEELMKILNCKQTMGQQVLPLFYDVDPHDIRHQTNNFGEAFAKLKEKFKDDVTAVKEWKRALFDVADLSGENLKEYRNEPEFIDKILYRVSLILKNKTYFEVAPYPTDIDPRVDQVKLLLDSEKNDRTRTLGIFGSGGIGKTTLAKAIYNKIAAGFEASCFLGDIRCTCGRIDGLINLQNQLLSKILVDSNLEVGNVDHGTNLIKNRTCRIKLLLVLDDVDHSDQLEKIAGKGDWFGLGSRIIVTTRDRSLLTKHKFLAYEVQKLDEDKALELFSWHAFNESEPANGYVELTKDVIRYAAGLPLALTVLGSTLNGKDIPFWKDKLAQYKRVPHDDIQKVLRISFDGLNDNAKSIFLDIACFFKGEKVKYVREILDGCGFQSYSGIEELKDWCLVTESSGLLVMHDLLQDMGREIVRLESPNDPGKRSRLWFYKDVLRVLEENTGTNNVQGIWIDLPKPGLIHLSVNAFKEMKRLRLFISHNTRFSVEPNLLFKELSLLGWKHHIVMFKTRSS